MNVALPAIRADLHGGLATQEWVVDAYLLTLGSLLLVGGSLGDLFGRRRVFATGVAAFGVASLACAGSPDALVLIVARGVQGVAAALLVPATLALIMDAFTEDQRAGAIGSWTAWTGVATVLGPLLGGLLIQFGSWRWVFVVNVPLVLVTLRLVRHLPDRRPAADAPVDWLGGVLGAIGLAGPIYALIEQPAYGWSDPRVWAALAGGGVLLGMFVVWERQSATPMLPLSLLGYRNFRVGNLATSGFYGALSAMTFFLVVFLQQVAGYRPVAAGLALLPMSLLTFLLAKRFGALADRFGPRLFMGAGPIIAGIGALLLLGLTAHPRYVSDVLPGVSLFALGLAMTVAPLTATVLGAAGTDHSGVASAINNAVARIAGLVAIALTGAAVAGQFSAEVHHDLTRNNQTASYRLAIARAASSTLDIRIPSGLTRGQRPHARNVLEAASVDGFRLAILISSLLAIFSGVLSLIGIRNPGRAVSAAATPAGAICGASTDLGRATGEAQRGGTS